MKKNLLLFCIFNLIIFKSQSQSYRYIPDVNFRTYLRTTLALPFSISGDSLDVSSLAVTSLSSMNCPSRSISNLSGIEYFSSLSYLNCSNNSISSLSLLPASLSILNCSSNPLFTLGTLPPNLTQLSCAYASLSSISALPTTLEILNCTNNGALTISFLPSGLKELYIGNSFTFVSLPTLPSTLEIFECTACTYTSIPTLPAGLKRLNCGNNPITTLPILPTTLEYLYVDNCISLTSLGSLPSSLKTLSCTVCNLTTLGTLPASLTQLACQRNRITSLTLPPNLITLSCHQNNISSISSFPSSLIRCNMDYNPITTIPPLSNSLIEFTCGFTKLNAITELPSSLTTFYCNNDSMLSCLPYLPSSLRVINYSNCINLHCMPNFVSAASYTPAFTTLPLCNPYVHSCPSYTGITGSVYIDSNSNCLLDTLESTIKNINIVLQNGITILNVVSTEENGTFAFDTLSNNLYTIHIDTSNTPFTFTCPSSGFDSIRIDSTHRYIDNRNLSIECLPGFDLATTGLETRVVRPASTNTFHFNGGDIANIYGAHCTNISGHITIHYSGPLHFTGVEGASLIPDSIFSNRIVWNISDFSTLDFFHSILPIFTTDSSAVAGDLVCFTSEIFPIASDRNSFNNIHSQCFSVTASYDPNYKEVNPEGTVSSNQDWLYYTIHFQNTGSSYAENIYIWDTIDPSLNINTIQVLGASHIKFMQVYPSTRAVKFQFDEINLPDSTSDEPNSHGWVQYRIKLNTGLSEGTLIHNKAGIIFDLNAPIHTNTTQTKICNEGNEIYQTIVLPVGGSIVVGTHTYNSSGVYADLFSNRYGCDSMVYTTIQSSSCSPIDSLNQNITIYIGSSITVGNHTYTASGIYRDTFKTEDGSCDSIVIITYLNTINSINEKEQMYLSVFPNPTKNQVHLEFSSPVISPLNIIDMYGRIIYSSDEKSNKITIQTDTWNDGTYIITYKDVHYKLIVQH